MKKIVIGVDMDDVIVDFHSNPFMNVPRGTYNHPNVFRRGYFRYLHPFAGVIDKVRELMALPNVEVYIVTHPLKGSPDCVSEKVQWIEKYLPEINQQDRLVMICDKALFLGDYLLDDDIKWKTFQGNLILIDPTKDVAGQIDLFIDYITEDKDVKHNTPN